MFIAAGEPQKVTAFYYWYTVCDSSSKILFPNRISKIRFAGIDTLYFMQRTYFHRDDAIKSVILQIV